VTDHAQQGRRNRANGAAAERQGLAIIREFYPAADRTRGGITTEDIITSGIGDRVAEITRAGWNMCGAVKVDQAAGYARRAELGEWFVMKMVPGRGGQPNRWYMVTDARGYLERAAELDGLRAREFSVEQAFERGYEAGRRSKKDA